MLKKSIKIKIFFAVVTVLLCMIFLLSGCTAGMSRNWVQNTIEQHFYVHPNDGDYSKIEGLSGLSIDEMVARLDRYSAYYTKKQYEAVVSDNAGSKSGIGITTYFLSGKGVVISTVVGNSPAKKKGIIPGDVIVGGRADGNNYTFSKLADFTSFVSGRATGEEFTLIFDDYREIAIAKEDYTASYAAMYTRDNAYTIVYEGADDKTPEVAVEKVQNFEFLPENAAYITLSQFYGNAADEIGLLIKEFNAAHCTSLILDLRTNGGGYVDTMSQIAGRFTSAYGGNPVSMIARYKDGKEEYSYCHNYTDSSSILPKGTKVSVMADSGTASASEALIGVLVSHKIIDYSDIYLSDYQNGTAVKSYGKGIMQATYKYITGEALKLTVAGIFWPDGVTSIHSRGLNTTDMDCVAVKASGVALPGDEEVQFVAQQLK